MWKERICTLWIHSVWNVEERILSTEKCNTNPNEHQEYFTFVWKTAFGASLRYDSLFKH